MRGRGLALVVAASLVGGCTVGVRRGAPDVSRSPGSLAPVSVPPCRASYAPPDPKRPAVTLTFDVADDHRTVTGTQRVVFTPDRPVSEVVFRLWLNSPAARDDGGSIEVTDASGPMTFEAAGGSGQGTLLRVALPAESPAGVAVSTTLSFRMTLPRASIDRWGHTAHTAWWASAHPMLAWVRGTGWHTAEAIGMLGETAANETARYDVTVTAPFNDTVLSIASPSSTEATGEGRKRWRFRHETARDVALSVGPFSTKAIKAAGVPVTIAVSDELAYGAAAASYVESIERLTQASMTLFARQFGPFPYPSLTVVALEPIRSAGVEYPGLIWVGSQAYRRVVPHEVAHEWFYGLVGDDQAAHPWLDESFASYAEGLYNDESGDRFVGELDGNGAVGRPMSYWDDNRDSYGRVVYAKGAGALLTARAEVGEDVFDRLLRCYVRENAHTVATPDDVAAAFAPAPRVLDILRAAEALP